MDGHFDYGNGFHGRVYLNPPSAVPSPLDDLASCPGPARHHPRRACSRQTDVVAGPVTGGALLAHTLAGLLDGRRALTHPPYSFAAFGGDEHGHPRLSPFYRQVIQRAPRADCGRCAEHRADFHAVCARSWPRPAGRRSARLRSSIGWRRRCLPRRPTSPSLTTRLLRITPLTVVRCAPRLFRLRRSDARLVRTSACRTDVTPGGRGDSLPPNRTAARRRAFISNSVGRHLGNLCHLRLN